MLTIKEINQMDLSTFVSEVGWVFEHSPWVAEKAWEFGPFTSTELMYQLMVDVVTHADTSDKLSLLRAHPDLGTRLEISTTSKKEQLQAGLNQLSECEFNEFSSLNQQYTNKFGFPFIMAVRGKGKQAIKEAISMRISLPYESEIETAIQEVFKIARFRLSDFVSNDLNRKITR